VNPSVQLEVRRVGSKDKVTFTIQTTGGTVFYSASFNRPGSTRRENVPELTRTEKAEGVYLKRYRRLPVEAVGRRVTVESVFTTPGTDFPFFDKIVIALCLDLSAQAKMQVFLPPSRLQTREFFIQLGETLTGEGPEPWLTFVYRNWFPGDLGSQGLGGLSREKVAEILNKRFTPKRSPDAWYKHIRRNTGLPSLNRPGG
jgi:hypothetical protein